MFITVIGLARSLTDDNENVVTPRGACPSMGLSLAFSCAPWLADTLASVTMVSKAALCGTMGRVQGSATRRETQRENTRARLLDAAIVEFQRAGAHAADINAIVKAAGVARSTFYFHFPTKEHVLLELIRRDEMQLANELGRFLDTRPSLPAVLKTIIELVLDLESRWGTSLFHDVISLYFSPALPEREQWTNHPIFVLLAAEIERARIRGE
ncbi:MAG: TetR/AcrR family transcriptional regulator, partial [Actinomycetota bacterium]|nr:TetR/AcrR family transcriptional regulator [Actinomycetota bacterium]